LVVVREGKAEIIGTFRSAEEFLGISSVGVGAGGSLNFLIGARYFRPEEYWPFGV
jgi:hypothetical protein